MTTDQQISAPGFGATVRAELIKVRHSPSLWVLLLVTLAIAVGLTALVTVGGGAGTLYERQAEGGGATYEVLFFGPTLGVWAFAFFGATTSAGEFGSGVIRYSFVATPDRARVLLAKLVSVAGLGVVAGLAISAVDFALTQGMLHLAGYPALSLRDPGLVRVMLVFIPVQMLVWGSFAMLFGVVVRRPAAAAIILFLGSLLPVVVAQYLPPAWGETVPRWMPGALIESLSGLSVPGSEGYLPLGPAVAAILAWIAAFVVLGLVVIRRRDA
ncbi:hypothetical protein ACIG47_22300 [Promicromonospora sp. NPDC052451]|uniref:hypothetical protein n=1 Tax=Promicromonospora sp. NPDC052451 TaxID=3364407 RepID=UPI0037C725D2